MCLITLCKLKIEILSLIEQLRVMGVVYILIVLHMISVNTIYTQISLLTTRQLLMEVLSNGLIFGHLI